MLQVVDKRSLAAIHLAVVLTLRPFPAPGGELAAFEHAGGSIAEFRQDRYPIIEVAGRALALVMDNFRVSHESPHRTREQMSEVDAVGKHVAQFARPGQLLDLAPTEVARPPIQGSLT